MGSKKKNPSRFLQESEAQSAGLLAETTTTALAALFDQGSAGAIGGMERMNLPTMIKPGSMPVGAVLIGRLHKVCPSPVTTIKGSLLWLELATVDKDGKVYAKGREITFPATGSVRSALAGPAEGPAAVAAMEKHIGKLLVLRREPDSLNKKYNKSQFIFDVRLSTRPVELLDAEPAAA